MKVTRSQRIIIVADEAQFELMRGPLAARGFVVTAAPDYDSAYRELLEGRFDLIVIDLAEAVAGGDFIKGMQGTKDLTQPLLLVVGEWGTGGATLALRQREDAYEPNQAEAARCVDCVR